MTALLERPGPRQHVPLRVALRGLCLSIAHRTDGYGYEATLDPATARRLAADLLVAAARVELAASPILEELAQLVMTAETLPVKAIEVEELTGIVTRDASERLWFGSRGDV